MRAAALLSDFRHQASGVTTEEEAARGRLRGMERNFKWAKERYIHITPPEQRLKDRLHEEKCRAMSQFQSDYKQLRIDCQQGILKIGQEERDDQVSIY